MRLSMAVRFLFAAAVAFALTACGGDSTARQEVRLLAPVGVTDDTSVFERRTGCRVDLRVYDEGEDLDAIAERRNVDVVAGPAAPGQPAHDSVELVRVELARGLEVTIPRELAQAFDKPSRPAGRRRTRWEIREEGANDACAQRWLDYAASQ
jgi:hypothetical protein